MIESQEIGETGTLGERGEFEKVEVPLSETQGPTYIALVNSSTYYPDDLFALIMYDPDAPNGTYYHSVEINLNKRLRGGNTLLNYESPKRVGHHYTYELFLQTRSVSKVSATRTQFDLDAFIYNNDLQLISKIVVVTTGSGNNLANQLNTAPRKRVPRKLQSDDGTDNNSDKIRHDFMKPNSGLSDGEKKYCRCVLHVEAKGSAYNPYAVCAKSTKHSVHTCGEHYDFEAMPLAELNAYASLKGITVPDSGSRRSVINAIYQWKETEGK